MRFARDRRPFLDTGLIAGLPPAFDKDLAVAPNGYGIVITHDLVRAFPSLPSCLLGWRSWEKLVGNDPVFWLKMQAAHDAWHAARSIDVHRIPALFARHRTEAA